jgi:FkbM family methyltransferase
MLWRALKNIKEGSYIDIGAQHPIVDSVSMAFYEKGWRGAHCEPNSQYAAELRMARPDELVYEEVIGANEATVPFYEIKDTGLSTCDKALADLHASRGWHYTVGTRKVSTLDRVFDRFGSRDIHWLKVDVEGFEKQVFQGWRDSHIRPWIIVAESVCPDSRKDLSGEWQELLTGKDYAPVYFDGLNWFYLHRDHADLSGAFAAPPNVFDDFVFSELASASLCQRVSNDWQARFAPAENELRVLRSELASILNSGSWRITGPLRKLRSFCMGGRG